MPKDLNLDELERQAKKTLREDLHRTTVEFSNLSEGTCDQLEARFEDEKYVTQRIFNLASTRVEEPYYILHVERR